MTTQQRTINPSRILGLGFSPYSLSGAEEQLIATGSTINIRAQPSTTSAVLRTAKKGEVVGSIADSFVGGDNFVWYELLEGGFVREDVASPASTTAQAPIDNKNLKLDFKNPWVLGLAAVGVVGIGLLLFSGGENEESEVKTKKRSKRTEDE